MGKKKILKNVLLVFVIVILSLSLAYLAGAQEWRDLIIRAENSVRMGEISEEEAERYLYEARDFALNQGDWRGVIRAGFGFILLKNEGEAIQSWFIGRDMAWNQGSWEGLFRAGQGFVMLREEKEAYEAFRGAQDMAWKQGNWEGLFRAGRGFAMLKQDNEAREAFRGVQDMAEAQRSWEGLFRAGQGFELIGAQNAAEEFYKEAESIAEEQGGVARDNLRKRIRFFTDTLLIQTIGGFEPGLAKYWEEVDERSIQIFLRTEISCLNGTPFDAKSIENTFYTNPNWPRLGIQSVRYYKGEYTVLISSESSNLEYLHIILSDPETSIKCP